MIPFDRVRSQVDEFSKIKIAIALKPGFVISSTGGFGFVCRVSVMRYFNEKSETVRTAFDSSPPACSAAFISSSYTDHCLPVSVLNDESKLAVEKC